MVLPFKAFAIQSRNETMDPSLVTARRQQDLELGEGKKKKKKTQDPKEGILFISTFDLDYRHIALFQRTCRWAQPQCLRQVAKTSRPLAGHWVLFVFFVLTVPVSCKTVSRGRSPSKGSAINPKQIACQNEIRKPRKTQARQDRKCSLVFKEVGEAIAGRKREATLLLSYFYKCQQK